MIHIYLQFYINFRLQLTIRKIIDIW